MAITQQLRLRIIAQSSPSSPGFAPSFQSEIIIDADTLRFTITRAEGGVVRARITSEVFVDASTVADAILAGHASPGSLYTLAPSATIKVESEQILSFGVAGTFCTVPYDDYPDVIAWARMHAHVPCSECGEASSTAHPHVNGEIAYCDEHAPRPLTIAR